MSLDFTKVNYVDGSTIIEADNLNDIQDAILALDSNKVEAESGKGLSTEDYTSAEKSKLSGIQTGAQVNPGNATTSADGLMSSVDKAKLDGIATGATAVTIDSTLTVVGQAADAKATGDAIGDKYTKPNGGIPKTDLESSVQVSLGKADTALQSSLKGEANGVAELDSNGKVPTSQLPSFVDDVLEYASLSEFPVTGETGKIYVATDTNKTYRWGGTTYIEISASLALGETSSTAYRGDRGAAAYTHAVTNKGSAFSNGLYKITTNSEGHVTAATSVTENDLTSLGVYAKPDTGIPKTDLASDVQTSLDKADSALQSVPSTYRTADAQDTIDTAIESGLAIVAAGNSHAAIASGQYVYIKGHATLTEGLYKATTAIPLDGTLSSTNVSAAGGVFNDLTTVEQIPVTVSSTDARIKSTSTTATCYRCGRIAILDIASRWDFSETPYDAGSSVVMTVSGAPQTFADMRSIAFHGTRIFIGWLGANGNVTVRNFASDAATNANTPISISFFYLCS